MEKKKIKCFLSGKVTHTIIIELFQASAVLKQATDKCETFDL